MSTPLLVLVCDLLVVVLGVGGGSGLAAAAASKAPVAAACEDGAAPASLEVPIAGDAGDAFQYKRNGVTYSGSTGEIYMGRSAYHGSVISALRFQDLRVPRRAKILSASVALVDAHVGTVCCQGMDLTVLLRLERAAYSRPLPKHYMPGWLLSRLPTTPALAWRPPSVGTYNQTETPNFGPGLQSIVSLDGWAPGNAVTVLLDGEGETGDVDERAFFGSGPSGEHGAKLKVTFCKPAEEETDKRRNRTTLAAAKVAKRGGGTGRRCPQAECPKCPRRPAAHTQGAPRDVVAMSDATASAPESATRASPPMELPAAHEGLTRAWPRMFGATVAIAGLATGLVSLALLSWCRCQSGGGLEERAGGAFFSDDLE